MFDFAEQAFDQVALFAEFAIKASPRCRSGPARHDGPRACGGDGVHRALAIIAFVGKDMAGLQAVEQRLDLGDVVALAAGQEEADRVPQGVGGDMDLRGQTVLRSADRVSLSPFFWAPALCWCARTMVESTSTYSKSGWSAKALKRRSQTPSLHHRLNR